MILNQMQMSSTRSLIENPYYRVYYPTDINFTLWYLRILAYFNFSLCYYTQLESIQAANPQKKISEPLKMKRR